MAFACAGCVCLECSGLTSMMPAMGFSSRGQLTRGCFRTHIMYTLCQRYTTFEGTREPPCSRRFVCRTMSWYGFRGQTYFLDRAKTAFCQWLYSAETYESRYDAGPQCMQYPSFISLFNLSAVPGSRHFKLKRGRFVAGCNIVRGPLLVSGVCGDGTNCITYFTRQLAGS